MQGTVRSIASLVEAPVCPGCGCNIFVFAKSCCWVYEVRQIKKLRSLIPFGKVFTEFLSRKPDPFPLWFSVYRLC